MSLAKLKALKDEFQAKLKAEGADAVKDALKAFFAKHPEAKQIAWTQYTPHFNDGEACVFGVNEIQVVLKGGDGADSADDEDGLYAYSIRYDDALNARYPGLADAIEALGNELGGCSEALEAAFGDHAKITATADTVMVTEYNHD